ncbi:MAG: 8-oxo-dGTP diphosphatase [Oscillospiraceae bacterium]|nr:8-oxo-dGTP diphosphatase [Oscillospiraceae bacterium]
MKRSEQVELTVLCLLRQGDRILLQNRVKEDWHGYALPGGHVEPGESVVDAVVREMREETGLTVRRPRLCGLKQFPTEEGRYLVFLFLSEDFEGTLHSSAEGEMRWVRRSELAALSTVDDLSLLLDVMEREDLTEFQYVIRDGNWFVELR